MEEKDEGNGGITQQSLAVPDATVPNEDLAANSAQGANPSPTSIRHILRSAAERHKGNPKL